MAVEQIPLNVVVAVDRDPLPASHVVQDRLQRLVDPGKRAGWVLLLSGQKGLCRDWVAETAAHQHLRHRRAYP